MIALFTDFGWQGPYVGQMKTVLQTLAPQTPVIDLMHDAPVFDPQSSAYLLAALVNHLPDDAIVLGVVDPGVGGARDAIIVQADRRWYVGPDNGLFAVAARRAANVNVWTINERPEYLSASFHGRDLFAPVAARLVNGERPWSDAQPAQLKIGGQWPNDTPMIIYIDAYGNAMTGLRASTLKTTTMFRWGARTIAFARTFSAVDEGQVFWYENSLGLAEIAVNRGNAANKLALRIGAAVELAGSDSVQ